MRSRFHKVSDTLGLVFLKTGLLGMVSMINPLLSRAGNTDEATIPTARVIQV
jgi:hypothetical protein